MVFIAIGYQTALAYIVSLCIYQFGMLFTGAGSVIGTAVAFIFTAGFIFLLFRPYKEHKKYKEQECLMETFITGAIVVLCVFFAIRSMVNDKRNGKTHCGGDCSRCKGHCH